MEDNVNLISVGSESVVFFISWNKKVKSVSFLDPSNMPGEKGLKQLCEMCWLVREQFPECPPLCSLERDWPQEKQCSSPKQKCLIHEVCVCSVHLPPVSVVFVSVTPLFVFVLFLVFIIPAVPVIICMFRVASVAPTISGRRSAAVAASARGLAP